MVKEFGKNYEPLSYSLQLWEINCATKKQHILLIKEYSGEGNILNTNQLKAASQPGNLSPEGLLVRVYPGRMQINGGGGKPD